MNSKKKNKYSKGYNNILLPLGHKKDVNNLTSLAPLLLSDKNSKIHLLHLMIEGRYSHLPHEWRIGSKRVTKSHHMLMKKGIKSKSHVVTAKSIVSGVLQQARENDCDLILLGWGPKSSNSISGMITDIMSKATCDVIVFKGRNDPKNIEKIIYPFSLSPKERRLLMIGKIIENTGANLTFSHVAVTGEEEESSGRELLERASETAREVGIESELELLTGKDPVKEISKISQAYDLMILGPSRDWWLKQVIFGRTPDEIAANSDCSVLMHKSFDK